MVKYPIFVVKGYKNSKLVEKWRIVSESKFKSIVKGLGDYLKVDQVEIAVITGECIINNKRVKVENRGIYQEKNDLIIAMTEFLKDKNETIR